MAIVFKPHDHFSTLCGLYHKHQKTWRFWAVLAVLSMARRTKKVGICGKYGLRYGASLRKTIKKIEISQRKKYPCLFCGKLAVQRNVVGIWTCLKCGKSTAGGAYTPATPTGFSVRAAIKRLREAQTKSILALPSSHFFVDSAVRKQPCSGLGFVHASHILRRSG
jgi:large subunit ribosomal protein L37Ae